MRRLRVGSCIFCLFLTGSLTGCGVPEALVLQRRLRPTVLFCRPFNETGRAGHLLRRLIGIRSDSTSSEAATIRTRRQSARATSIRYRNCGPSTSAAAWFTSPSLHRTSTSTDRTRTSSIPDRPSYPRCTLLMPSTEQFFGKIPYPVQHTDVTSAHLPFRSAIITFYMAA